MVVCLLPTTYNDSDRSRSGQQYVSQRPEQLLNKKTKVTRYNFYKEGLFHILGKVLCFSFDTPENFGVRQDLIEVAMSEVECITLDGQVKKVRADCLIIRPAVYGIIVQDSKLLLLKMRETGKYHLPGGGIQVEEPMESALKREIREETGIEVGDVRLVHFEEIFFYYDPSDRAYHGLHFFYTCKPRTIQLLTDSEVDDASAEQPRWVEIKDLQPAEFQAHGAAILKLCS